MLMPDPSIKPPVDTGNKTILKEQDLPIPVEHYTLTDNKTIIKSKLIEIVKKIEMKNASLFELVNYN